MCVSGDPDDGPRTAGALRILARMAGVLGVAPTAFLASVSRPDEIEARERSAILALVWTYLDRAEPEARRRSVEALRALLDGGNAGTGPDGLDEGAR